MGRSSVVHLEAIRIGSPTSGAGIDGIGLVASSRKMLRRHRGMPSVLARAISLA
jgi:hypothetical protein